MLELVLIHRPRNGIPLEADLLKKISGEVPLWSTCLRQMMFVPGIYWPHIQNDVLESDEVYHGHEAYRFLLHVVCGLRSPLVGETEVQGQFKQFVAQIGQSYGTFWGLYSHFFQGILSESKKIRSQHLINLGSQSYGSLLRRRLHEDERVTLLGSGQLVGDILPWLKKVSHIDIHARRPEMAQKFKETFPQLEVQAWGPRAVIAPHSLVVIAAPIDNASLIKYLLGRDGVRLVDLRGEDSLSPEQLKEIGITDYEDLNQFMKEMNLDQQKIAGKVSLAEQMIQSFSHAFYNKTWLRPGGWEDLCG
jgi:glutamyl-tRNA reductase